MTRTTSIAIFLGTALLLTALPAAASAQADGDVTSPEGVGWRLTEYTADGALIVVPEGVSATMLLQDGEVTGSGGCNSFFGTYQIDGSSIDFGENLGRTEIFCEGDPQVVEDAYLATLPAITSWSVDGDALRLADDAGVLLTFVASMATVPEGDMNAVLAALEDLKAQVAKLQGRVAVLEAGTAEAVSPARPKPPRAPGKSRPVKTEFPDWMRDQFRPEAQRSDEKNREVVQWRDRARNESGFRVYAERGFCELKPGADTSRELRDRDFRTGHSERILIDTLPADSTSYRPDHAAIDAALPRQPLSPYSNDQFYELYVTAFSDAGESRPRLVGSYFLTPEFRCP